MGVFGVSLSDPPTPQIPVVIESAINHIIERGVETEGIFRISPSLSKLEDVVTEIEAGNPIFYSFYVAVLIFFFFLIIGNQVDWSKHSIHVAAGVIKEYLRQLPEPLLLDYNGWLTIEHTDEKLIPFKIQELIDQLPPPHRLLLDKIMRLSITILKNVEVC